MTKEYKKILLVKVPYCLDPHQAGTHTDYKTKTPFKPIPSLGLAALCGFIEKYKTFDYQLKAVDINIEPYADKDVVFTDVRMYEPVMEDTIKNNDYDVLGLSVMFVFNLRWLDRAVKLSRKYHPEAKIIVGGGYPTLFPERVLKENEVDDVVIGEGEATLLHLLNRYNNHVDKDFEERFPIAGYGTRKADGSIKIQPMNRNFVDLKDIPKPLWEAVNIDNYLKNSGLDFIPIEASRGCPYQCTFCCTFLSWGRGMRYKPVDQMIGEIRHLIDKFDMKAIHFIDDNMTVRKKWIAEFVRAFVNSNMPVGLRSSNFSALHLDEETIDLLLEAGMQNFGIAIEAGTQEVQSQIKKRMDLDKVKDTVALLKRKNVYIHINWMLGFPGETLQQIDGTFQLARELKANSNQFLTVLPYPGTELFEQARKKDLLLFDGDNLDNFDNRQCDYLKSEEWSYDLLQQKIYDANIEINFLNNPAIENPTQLERFVGFLRTVLSRLPDHVIAHIILGYLLKQKNDDEYLKHYETVSELLQKKELKKTFGKYLEWDHHVINDFNDFLEKGLRNIILAANAVDAEYLTPVVSEHFEAYRRKKKQALPETS